MADESVSYGIEIIANEATEQLEMLADTVDTAQENFTELAEAAEESMDRLSSSAESGSNSMDNLANSAQQGGRGLGQISRVVSMFSPALGKMVAGVGAAITAFKGLNTVISLLGKKMIIITAVLAAAGAAYALFTNDAEASTAAIERQEKELNRLKSAMDQAKTAQEGLASAQRSVNSAYHTQADTFKALELRIHELNGTSKSYHKRQSEDLEIGQKLDAFIEKRIQTEEAQASVLENKIKVIKGNIAANKIQRKHLKDINKETKIGTNAHDNFTTALANLTSNTNRQKESLKDLQRELTQTREGIDEITGGLSGTAEDAQSPAAEDAFEYLDLLEKIKKAEKDAEKRREKAAKRQRAIAAARARRQARERNREGAINKMLSLGNALSGTKNTLLKTQQNIQNKIQTNVLAMLDLEIERQKLIAKRLTGTAKEAALAKIAAMELRRSAIFLDQQRQEKDAILAADKAAIEKHETNLKLLRDQLKVLEKNRASKKQITAINEAIGKGEKELNAARLKYGENERSIRNINHSEQTKNNAEAELQDEQKTQTQLANIESIKFAINGLNTSLNQTDDPYAELNNSLADIRSQITTIRNEGVIPDVETQLKLLENGLKAFEDKARTEIKATIIVDKIQGALNQLDNALSQLSDPASMITGVAAGIGTALGGPAGAAIGQTFGSLVQGLTALGEKDPAEIEAEMMAFTQAFIKGLQVLPKILIKLLPKLITGLSLAILSAIPVLLVELIKAIGDILTGAFDALTPQAGEGFFEYLGRQITQIFDFWAGWLFGGGDDQGMRSGGSARPLSGRSGMRMTRGTGMALLHPNEFVVPQSGMAPQAVTRTLDSIGSGSNATNININSIVTERSAIDELVNRIEQRYQLFGQSRSTLFAG
tara:strand:+ start:15543 stop:18206 length:2664 start_codon:yes stop_codon:yes gene_type:complete